jgi:hypothetical protein
MRKNILILAMVVLMGCVTNSTALSKENVRDSLHVVYIEPNQEQKEFIPQQFTSNTRLYNRTIFKDPQKIFYVGRVVWRKDLSISHEFVHTQKNKAAVESAEKYLEFLVKKGVDGHISEPPLTDRDPPLRIPEILWVSIKSKFDDPESWFAVIDNKIGDKFYSENGDVDLLELAKAVNRYGKITFPTLVMLVDEQGRKYEEPYYPETKIYISGYGIVE